MQRAFRIQVRMADATTPVEIKRTDRVAEWKLSIVEGEAKAQGVGGMVVAADWQEAVRRRFGDDARAMSCGMCRHWRRDSPATPTVPHPEATGHCLWQTALEEAKLNHLRQSALAYPCEHFDEPPSDMTITADTGPSAPPPAVAGWRAWWQKGSRRVGRTDEVVNLVEQSGKSPGTRPCPTCSGRIANLGAVNTVTDKDDTRTFSLWRCRQCLVYFLEDWVDAWVRTDTLETSERMYRLAPAEALAVAAQMARCAYPSPQERRKASPEKRWLVAFVANRAPLRAVVRKG